VAAASLVTEAGTGRPPPLPRRMFNPPLANKPAPPLLPVKPLNVTAGKEIKFYEQRHLFIRFSLIFHVTSSLTGNNDEVVPVGQNGMVGHGTIWNVK